MDENENKFENYSNFNKDKRLKLIQNYNSSFKNNNAKADEEEASFEKHLINTKSFDENEPLIEIIIRYSILYLEEFNYDLKLIGLNLLDHLMLNTSAAVLNLNMRSKLILTTYEKNINDKEHLIFLDRQLESMCKLLNVIESSYSCGEHCFKQHSLVFDSILNNCYMTTNQQVKTIYYKNLIHYIKQMNVFTCRHLEKLLTVTFDCGLENSKINFDFEGRHDLLEKCLELLQVILETCSHRVNWHARRIINFLIKLLYFSCLEITNYTRTNKFTQHIINIIRNSKLIDLHFRNELNALKENKLNLKFIALIDEILNETL